MSNKPLKTREELVDWLAGNLEGQYNNPMHKNKLHDTCSDFVTCIEDWTVPWDEACEKLELYNEGRPNMIGMMMICMHEQLVKHRISANKYSDEGFRKAAEVMVNIFEIKTAHKYDEFYKVFHPGLQLVYDGKLVERELQK